MREAFDNAPRTAQQPKIKGAAAGRAREKLAEVHEIFRRWLGEDYDIATLDAMLAVAAAERLRGDPPWLLIISGPGNAKTETVQATSGLGAHVVSTITSDGALLSASPRKQRAKDATGGLLRKIGERGILAIKDFTSILSMDRNMRTAVLAALREIHDGRWERNVGTDGGQTLTWEGRIVVIGACTTAWDSAHAVIATMGDRFVIIRADSHVGRIESGRHAIRNTGKEAKMRRELADAVAGLVGSDDAHGLQADRGRREHDPGRRRSRHLGADRRRDGLPRRRDRRACAGDADALREATGANHARSRRHRDDAA